MARERLDGVRAVHYPNLSTVLMVERFIARHSGEYTRKRLWQRLPRKTMYQTFGVILAYLEASGKVVIARDQRVVWVWNPKLVAAYLKREELSWRR